MPSFPPDSAYFESKAAGYKTNVTTVTGNYTVTWNADGTIFVNAAGVTVTLPNAASYGSALDGGPVPGRGRLFTVKNTNSGSSTTVNATGCNVENAASYLLSAALAWATFQSDGSNWWRVA